MKISPERNKSKKKYPSIKDYKKAIMKTTFGISVALSPFTITSCMGAYRSPAHEKQIQESKINKKTKTTEIKPVQKKGEIKKPMMLKGDIATPVHLDENKKEPCKTDTELNVEEKKDTQKDDKKLKKEPKISPIKTRGIMMIPKDLK